MLKRVNSLPCSTQPYSEILLEIAMLADIVGMSVCNNYGVAGNAPTICAIYLITERMLLSGKFLHFRNNCVPKNAKNVFFFSFFTKTLVFDRKILYF
jgi:hypothetical protein